jgi:hypothetical protein
MPPTASGVACQPSSVADTMSAMTGTMTPTSAACAAPLRSASLKYSVKATTEPKAAR